MSSSITPPLAEQDMRLVTGEVASAGATREVRTRGLSGGGAVLMCGIRESTSDRRVATATVRLRLGMSGMIGTGAPLCQLLLRRRCRPASPACRWRAAGNDRSRRKTCNCPVISAAVHAGSVLGGPFGEPIGGRR